jgi:hypothetical protein
VNITIGLQLLTPTVERKNPLKSRFRFCFFYYYPPVDNSLSPTVDLWINVENFGDKNAEPRDFVKIIHKLSTKKRQLRLPFIKPKN